MAAPQPPQIDPHSQLASALGTRFAQQLFRVMPDHAKALGPEGADKTKFTTVVEFTNTAEGLDVVVKFSNSIPLPGIRVKIGWLGEQLSLLPPDPPTPANAAAVPQPQPQQPLPPQPPTPMQQREAALGGTAQPQQAFVGRRAQLEDDVGGTP